MASSATQKPNSPLQGYNPPDSSDTEEIVFCQIQRCVDLDTLQFFLISGSWVNSSAIHLAIKSRYDQLDPEGLYKDQFACDDFWESPSVDSAPMDTWEEADSMGMVPENQIDSDEEEEPWMLEEDYAQDGGMADILDEPDPNLNDLYHMVPYIHQQYKRYFSGRVGCSVQFTDNERMNNVYELAPKVWNEILNTLFSNLGSDDKIGLSIHHPSLTDPIFVPLTSRNKLNGDKIANMIAKVQQSKKELKYGEEMRVVFIYSTIPKGQGFKRDYQGSVKEHKEKHAGHGSAFITIKNQDKSCCARAIVTAKAKVDKDPKYSNILRDHGRNSMQKRLAMELMNKAGLNPDQACGFPEIGKMKQVLGAFISDQSLGPVQGTPIQHSIRYQSASSLHRCRPLRCHWGNKAVP
ncbi:MAG: hypothetical protein GY696_37425 [Gammaproteobacteria bacterium]|nr:hypothetical protein [Gammaproteobacteria bacterium]